MDIKQNKPIKIVSRFTHKEMDDVATIKKHLGYKDISNSFFLEVLTQELYNKLQSGSDLCDILNINHQ